MLEIQTIQDVVMLNSVICHIKQEQTGLVLRLFTKATMTELCFIGSTCYYTSPNLSQFV